MRARSTFLALTLGLGVALAAGAAAAESLDLVCHVHWTKPGARRDGLRRIDIDLSAKTARFSDNEGRGWQAKGEHPIVSADRSRIVLDAGGGKDSYVDRLTGDYYFHNAKDGVTIRGPCEKAAPERPRF